jgi:two-component system sporulation sensor kinase A
MRITQETSLPLLKDRLNLFYNAFQHSTDAIILTDLHGSIIEANDAFTNLFGWTREEAVGKNTRILRSAKTTNEFYRQMWESVNRQGRWQGEIVNRRKDGSDVPVLLSITPIYNEGKKIGYMGVEIDITEKKRIEHRLRQEKEFSESIIETANSLIVGLDLQGSIILFNKKCEEATGYKKHEALGKNWFDLFIPANLRSDLHEVFQTVTDGKLPSRYENNILTKRGEECLISWSNTFLQNEKHEITGVLGIGIDITELKNLEKQFLQAERWATIGKMAAKVAHEIRNPLSSISLNVELLEDEIDNFHSANTHEAKALLKAMTAEIDRVSALTEEYLQFSRLPQITLTRGSLEEAVEEVVAFMRHELGQKKIEPEVRLEKSFPELLIDRVQIRRVLLNIMRNAMEAMPKGGKLKIRMEENEHRAVLHIADTGMGIPAETINKIFDPFFTTKDFGTGLGLAIVQQIIDEHGGQITCTSKLGEGTTFSIALPLHKTA